MEFQPASLRGVSLPDDPAASPDICVVSPVVALEPAMTLPGALTLRVRAFIEGQLADPGLTTAAVARARHVPLRYLYKLFEGSRRAWPG